MRAVFPVRDDAQPPLVVVGQAGQGLVHAGQVGRPAVGLGQAHPGQQGAGAQLPGADPGRQQRLDPRRDAGGVDDLLQPASESYRRVPPSSATASASLAGSSPATRSPSRWEQLIPAAGMNVARPSWPAQSASQVARSRDVSSRGSPPPPSSALISGLVMLRRPGSVPPQIRPFPANPAAASSRAW